MGASIQIMNNAAKSIKENTSFHDQNRNLFSLVLKEYFVSMVNNNQFILDQICESYVKNFFNKKNVNQESDDDLNSMVTEQDDEGKPDLKKESQLLKDKKPVPIGQQKTLSVSDIRAKLGQGIKNKYQEQLKVFEEHYDKNYSKLHKDQNVSDEIKK